MDIKDYIHLYINSEALYRKWYCDTPPEQEPTWSKLTTKRFQLLNDLSIERVEYALRRLEDMKHDDMLGLLQSMVPDDLEDKPVDDDYSLCMFYNDNALMVDGDVLVGADYTCICYDGQIAIKKCGTICAYDEAGDEQELVNAPKAYHYLLKQGFDLFGLIDAGLAIDAKTINK